MITSTADAAQRLREDPLSILEDLLSVITTIDSIGWDKLDHFTCFSRLGRALTYLKEATLGQDLVLPRMIHTDEELEEARWVAGEDARIEFDGILNCMSRLQEAHSRYLST